jgi:hypothetical protein
MPLLAEFLTAWSIDELAGPLMLTFATAGFLAFAVTQSIPFMMDDTEPAASQSSTFTPMSGAPGATPTTALVLSSAASVPATCVPWPSQS